MQGPTGQRAVNHHPLGPPAAASPIHHTYDTILGGVTGSDAEDFKDTGPPAVASPGAVKHRRSSRIAANNRNGEVNTTAGSGVDRLHGEGVGGAVLEDGNRVARGNSKGPVARKRSRVDSVD
ncbi:hypothetical protein GGS21DRAFT_489922 [Xylaria nigripes]|nr:hypothetical protein GGS21DRAFT_489922 [Xylaria nigripes]